MAGNPLEQVLLELGIDFTPVQEAKKVVLATIGDLNRITDQYQAKSTSEGEAQLARVRAAAAAAVAGATASIAEEKKKQAILESQTAELGRQIAAQKLETESTTQSLGAEEKKLAILRQQTEERRRELLEIQRENAESKRRQHEEGEGGFLNKIGHALLTPGGITSLATGVAGGVIGGELAVEAIEKVVDKLKEITKEAGSINLLQDQFEKLARGAGVDANKMLSEMQEHTEGLIDRFRLLQTASAALKSNLVAPERVAEAMGAVVRLSEAQGKSAEQGIQALNRALLTGRGNALAMATGLSIIQTRLTNLPPGLSAAERGTIQLNRTLDLIIQKSHELGEMPSTFEQMGKRLAIAVKDITLAFGQGINESPGAQMFLAFVNGIAGSLHSLQDVAKAAGRGLGDAFGVAATTLKLLQPTVDALWAAFKNLVDIVTGLLGSAAGFDRLRENASATREEFEKTHPILIKIVSAFAVLAGLTQKISENILAFTNALKEHEVLIKALGAAAIVALGGPEVAIGLGLIGAGVKRGAFGPEKEPEGLNAVHLGHKAGAKDVIDLMAHGWTPGQHQTEDWEQEFIDQYTKYQKLLDEHSGVMTAGGGAQGSTDNAAQIRKEAQLRLQLEIEAAKQRLEYKKQEIQDEKALDDEAYRRGEEDLQHHMDAQRQIAMENLGAERRLAYEEYLAKQQQAEASYEITKKQYEDIGMAGSKAAQDAEKNYKLQIKILQEGYQLQYSASMRKFEAELTRIAKEGEDDRKAATLKDIGDRLAAEKESVKAQEELAKRAFGERQIDPNTYYARRAELIHQEALAEIQAANETYAQKAHNEKSLAELQASLRSAQQKSQEAVDKLYLDKVKDQLNAIKNNASGPQQLATAQFGVATALNNPEAARQTAEGAIANLDQQRDSLVGMLPVLEQFPELYSSTLNELEQITQEQIHWREELEKLPDTVQRIGQGLGALGGNVGTIFHSRFAQNLGESIQAGARNVTQIPTLQRGIAGQDVFGNKITDPLEKFVGQITAGATALTDFVAALTSAKSAVAGGIGGAIGGAGFGETVGGALGKLFPSLGASAGPIGALGGAAIGGTIGLITGSKQAAVKRQIDELNTTFKNLMYQFGENTNNLQSTIIQLEALINQARQMQASSKKGSSQYQQLIDQYNDQLHQLQVQQLQTLRDLRQQIAILQEPSGAQGYLSDLKQILDQYQKFEGAAQNAQDLADATQYLTESLQNYELNLENQLRQDNTQAINDALQLNDLLWQRNQMIIEYNQQVSQVLSAGVLTRQLTRAQTAGQQIYQLQINYERQKEQIDEQIAATQYKVDAEQKVFDLATTRIGLETQLLTLQNQQTQQDMVRIAALSALIQQFSSGNLTSGALGNLLSSLQGVTPAVPGASNTDIVQQLEKLFAAAYQDRAGLGYGAFRAQNL